MTDNPNSQDVTRRRFIADTEAAADYFQALRRLLCLAFVTLALPLAAAKPQSDAALARTILADTNLTAVLDKAKALLKSGFNAGSGYGEVWIRDFNTFIELALTVNEPAALRAQLLPFFQFQDADGDIVDGVIPAAKANVGYREVQPMVERALRDGFVEWYDIYNRPQGSRKFRGAAGTLGQAVVLLQAWAEAHQ